MIKIIVDKIPKEAKECPFAEFVAMTNKHCCMFPPERIVVPPFGKSSVISTDVKAYMQEGEVLILHVRSSIGIKRGLTLSNCTGVIDKDFYSNPDNDGNICFVLQNNTDKKQVIEKGERVMQGIFMPFLIADDDETTAERLGGIGSSGK